MDYALAFFHIAFEETKHCYEILILAAKETTANGSVLRPSAMANAKRPTLIKSVRATLETDKPAGRERKSTAVIKRILTAPNCGQTDVFD